jgi:heme/copper-type cytochrome/quinol oxidase subunit 4
MRLAPMVASGILVIAFIKVALIMAYFMELRWAPNTLVAVATVWTIVEFALLVWPFAL